MTTGEFLKLLSEDIGWTVGEDFGNESDILLRKNCARIIHRYLQKVKSEADETADLPARADIPDLFDCRICAPHIIQVVAKGIMKTRKRGGLNLFDGDAEVSGVEAESYILRIRSRGE